MATIVFGGTLQGCASLFVAASPSCYHRFSTMKTILDRISSALFVAALASACVCAQTTTTTPKPAPHKPAAGSAASSTAMKLPPNIPVVKGILKTEFALKYIDVKVGTGDLAKPGIKYTVHYTGWLHDGTKFDSSVDRGQPFEFVQGRHSVITGWDEGFDGMRVGGKRRLLLPGSSPTARLDAARSHRRPT